MVSDSVRPTDRPAARSAAEQILSFFGSEDPTDRPYFTARGGSEAVFQAFQPSLPDRPTLSTAAQLQILDLSDPIHEPRKPVDSVLIVC